MWTTVTAEGRKCVRKKKALAQTAYAGAQWQTRATAVYNLSPAWSLLTLRSGEQNSSCVVIRSYMTLVRRCLSLRSCLRSCGQVLGTPFLNCVSFYLVSYVRLPLKYHIKQLTAQYNQKSQQRIQITTCKINNKYAGPRHTAAVCLMRAYTHGSEWEGAKYQALRAYAKRSLLWFHRLSGSITNNFQVNLYFAYSNNFGQSLYTIDYSSKQ